MMHWSHRLAIILLVVCVSPNLLALTLVNTNIKSLHYKIYESPTCQYFSWAEGTLQKSERFDWESQGLVDPPANVCVWFEGWQSIIQGGVRLANTVKNSPNCVLTVRDKGFGHGIEINRNGACL